MGHRAIDILWPFKYKDKKIIQKNFSIVLANLANSKNIKKISKKNFYHFADYLIDFFVSAKLTPKNVEKTIQSQGEEFIKNILNNNQGLICVTSHIGNWELGAAYLGLKGYDINVVALEHKNKRINTIFDERRSNNGLKVLPLGQASKGCVQTLKQGKILALLGDRIFDPAEKAVTVNFFNHKIQAPRGPAYLSIRTNSPIIPSFVIMQGNGKYIVHFLEPLNPPTYNKETFEQDTTNLMQKYISCFEQYVRKYPTQWFAFQDIWK